MAKYGRKVKRSKSLYKRRKSSGRKALEIAAMVILVGTMGLIGFAAGRPLINFFFGERPPRNNDIIEWQPDEQQTVDNGQLTVNNYIEDEPFDEPIIFTEFNAIYAPSSVLDNATSLAAYIHQASLNGYNAVILEMKDATGHLFYTSTFEPVMNTEIIQGTLSAEQIIGAFDNTNVIPIARLNTAFDSLAGRFIDDTSYTIAGSASKWMDNTPEAGGKFWINPFLQGSRDYISFLVGELAEAGFGNIILANTIFPLFTGFDRTILDARYFDVNTRSEELLGLIQACYENSGSAQLILEMSLKDVLENYAGFNATAEILRVNRNLNSDISLLLTFFRGDFGTELRTGESSSVILPNDMFGLTLMLYRQALNQTGEHNLIPALINTGLSESETAEALRAFQDLEFDSFAIR
jgi:hypothetical protein